MGQRRREGRVLEVRSTFELVVVDGAAGIRCTICGLTSWHPEDVRNRYCGRCYRFHELR